LLLRGNTPRAKWNNSKSVQNISQFCRLAGGIHVAIAYKLLPLEEAQKKGAQQFIDWLVSPEGQQAIANYRSMASSCSSRTPAIQMPKAYLMFACGPCRPKPLRSGTSAVRSRPDIHELLTADSAAATIRMSAD